jgi:DNA-directed RNA polymerase specialized sigma24 family protein
MNGTPVFRTRATPGAKRDVALALRRRGTRERLVLALLLVERLTPLEVAGALGVSVRQVERTVASLFAELRGAARRPVLRARRAAEPARMRRSA